MSDILKWYNPLYATIIMEIIYEQIETNFLTFIIN